LRDDFQSIAAIVRRQLIVEVVYGFLFTRKCTGASTTQKHESFDSKVTVERNKNSSSERKIAFLLEAKVVLGAAKVPRATVYQKHSSLLTRKRMYRG